MSDNVIVLRKKSGISSITGILQKWLEVINAVES